VKKFEAGGLRRAERQPTVGNDGILNLDHFDLHG
jgi:hypothetical protein